MNVRFIYRLVLHITKWYTMRNSLDLISVRPFITTFRTEHFKEIVTLTPYDAPNRESLIEFPTVKLYGCEYYEDHNIRLGYIFCH